MGEALVRPLGRPGDLGWVVMAHGEVYDAEFGWDACFEALVARIVADYANDHDPAREAAWMAELDGAASGACSASPRTTRPPSCGSCLSTPPPEAITSEVAWWTNVWLSPAGPAIGA